MNDPRENRVNMEYGISINKAIYIAARHLFSGIHFAFAFSKIIL